MKRDDITTPRDAAAYFLAEHNDLFTEAYQVGDATELVIRGRTFRVEIIEPIQLNPSSRNYDVRVYEKKDDLWRIWNDFPWCDRDSKAEVMMQALSFFWDRLRDKEIQS